jgi:hypothetical protein
MYHTSDRRSSRHTRTSTPGTEHVQTFCTIVLNMTGIHRTFSFPKPRVLWRRKFSGRSFSALQKYLSGRQRGIIRRLASVVLWMIASAGVTPDEREWEDTGILWACFASGRTTYHKSDLSKGRHSSITQRTSANGDRLEQKNL